MFETTTTTTPIHFFDLILMSTLTWMTEKELKIKKTKQNKTKQKNTKQQNKNKGDQFRWKIKREILYRR